jgi:hypothetical protein
MDYWGHFDGLRTGPKNARDLHPDDPSPVAFLTSFSPGCLSAPEASAKGFSSLTLPARTSSTLKLLYFGMRDCASCPSRDR